MGALNSIAHAQRRGEPVTLNFANAEIDAVARAMASIMGRNVVVDPRVKGQINLLTERAVPPAQAWDQFSSALRMQGFAVVNTDGLYKVVPEADAKLQAGAVAVGTRAVAGRGGQIVTQIFRLNHENAANLLPVLRPLISPNNVINVNPGNNSIVVTDYADNLQRVAKIIASMDLPNATGVEIIRLRHAIATDLAPLVARLVEGGGSGTQVGAPGAPGTAPDGTYRTTLLAEPRSNALIVRAANPARMALVRSLIEKLDQPSNTASGGEGGGIHVIYLKNADAVKLAATLRAAMAAEVKPVTSQNQPGAQGAGGAGAGGTPAANTATGAAAATSALTQNQPSTGGQIQADPATNALIITAPEPQMRQLRAVINQLDTRRAQVYVETVIAEVSADKAAEFGIQWQTPLGHLSNGVLGVIGTSFGTSNLAGQGANSNLLQLAGQTAMAAANYGKTGVLPSAMPQPGLGANLGILTQRNGIPILGALVRALQKDGDGNILSTPNLLTLDNEEARIIVGQNVPFLTGQFTNTNSGGTGAVNPFQTFERKDVGITLRVKPQISENGAVKMQIYQEVSSIDQASMNSSQGYTTNKRAIESNVLVQDGGIVVLGGLLTDEFSDSTEKMPVLGDIPVIGNLFKTQTRKGNKRNLMVFLRPIVLRDAASTESFSLDRYDLMRAVQSSVQPEQRLLVPINQSPTLPALERGQAGELPRSLINVDTMRPTKPAPLAQPAPTAPDIVN